MSAVRTIYAVSSGEYSDYGVQCLFETRELAEEYADAYRLAQGKREQALWGGGACDCATFEQHEDSRHEIGWDRLRVEEFQCWSVVPVLKVVEYGDIENEEPA